MSEKKMILSNGPLTAVLIQIKFSTIVQIAKYIPDIQDSLRKKYPLYDVLQGENIQSGPHGEIEKQEFTQWYSPPMITLEISSLTMRKLRTRFLSAMNMTTEVSFMSFYALLEVSTVSLICHPSPGLD